MTPEKNPDDSIRDISELQSPDTTIVPHTGNELDVHELEEIPEFEKKNAARVLFEWVEIFAYSFAAIVLIFMFVGRHAIVDGESMMKTLSDRDKLVISNLFYTPKQGDIVVFQVIPPRAKNEPLIKRVIATEGQVVDIDFATWTVTVDGVPLEEDYVNYIQGAYMYAGDLADRYPMTVEPGKIFVMGDNRNASLDSRSSEIGQVDARYVMGKVLFRFYPFDKIGAVKANVD